MIPENFFSARIENVDVHNIINRAIEANEDYISDQVTNQLDKGLDGEGGDLGEYRNYEYKNRWDPVDLKLTGAFRKSIYPELHEDYIEMNASDPKTEKLTERYGDAILDLGEEGVNNTIEILKPEIQQLYSEEVMK
jgi:hypothetical protein